MTNKRKTSLTIQSLPAGLIYGVGLGITATIAGAALISYMISKELIKETGIGYASMILVLISSFVAAKLSTHKTNRKIIFIAGIAGILYYGVLLSMTVFLFGGQFYGMGVTALLVLAGCGTAVLTGIKPKKQATYSAHKIHHR